MYHMFAQQDPLAIVRLSDFREHKARVCMHLAMASGAPIPAAQAGDEGFTISSVQFSAMAATPSARRPATTALSLGTSPKAKRNQRIAPPGVSQVQRDFSVTEPAAGVHELNAKVEAKAMSVTAAKEAIDDHASRLDTPWCLLV